MALAQSGLDPELREILLRDKPAHMLALGRRGTVPLLALPDGTVMEESVEIMDWALLRSDPNAWLRNRSDPARLALLEHNDGAFKADLDRYKYPERSPKTDAEPITGARERAVQHLDAIEALLTEPFLDGDRPGFYDAAIFPFIRQFAAVDREWFERLPLPRLIDWCARMLEHPDFMTVMNKVPPWKEGDVPTPFRSTLC